VSSLTGEIIAFIEASIENAIPSIKQSKHYYDLDKNDSVRNNHIYAVRPSSARSVSGAIRSVTMEQEFEIEISRDYVENGSSDAALRNAINLVYQDNEKILREISLRKTTINNVLKVSEPSFDAPKVNDKQKSVSITFSYPITYRKPIKGD
jgi:hypothetical protein